MSYPSKELLSALYNLNVTGYSIDGSKIYMNTLHKKQVGLVTRMVHKKKHTTLIEVSAMIRDFAIVRGYNLYVSKHTIDIFYKSVLVESIGDVDEFSPFMFIACGEWILKETL